MALVSFFGSNLKNLFKMFKYILSFFRDLNEDDESPEEVLKSFNPVDIDKPLESAVECDGSFKTSFGKITSKSGTTYKIDNLYEFTSDDDLQVGANVTYQRLLFNSKLSIYNVREIIDEDWDRPKTSSGIVSSRIMICQVVERNKRILCLDPGGIKLDLDKTISEFVPIVGDWLEIDVKYEVNEQTLDLSGEVIEISKINPVRVHIETGKVVKWDTNTCEGIINQSIFFNKDSLSIGYRPQVGDKVTAEVIESDQNGATWRALRVLPGDSQMIAQFNEEILHENVEISYEDIKFNTISKETKNVDLMISNKDNKPLEMISIKFQGTLKELHQIIEPFTQISIIIQCVPQTIGVTKDILEVQFKDFKIRKFLVVRVGSETYQGTYYQKPTVQQIRTNQERQIVRGPQLGNTSKFKVARQPDYFIPKHLLELIDLGPQELMDTLKVMKKNLFTNLNPMNYEEKFHTLLHVEEMENQRCIRQYDQNIASFIKNQEYLMLEIENLAERRPSIVFGDRIIAYHHSASQEYEANIAKIGSKHLYLKFANYFHDTYQGEDYSIRIVPGRGNYKRQHNAVGLAMRYLGRDWLFPSKVMEKSPQIDKDIVEWYNKELNVNQKSAVKNIIKGVCRPLPYIIFGPPGTGKTITVVESILQTLVFVPQSRLLVTAPSNSAADLIALRLIDSGHVRPGHLVRLVSVNYALGEQIPAVLLPYCATGSLSKDGTSANENALNKNGMTFDCSRQVLGRHRITVSTCSSAGVLKAMGFPSGHFTHIFVDEAGQAAESETLIPISLLAKHSGQVVLAGDHHQLGPSVMSRIASECGLSESFLERLISRFPYARDVEGFPDSAGYDPRLVTKLLQNYRSCETILKLYSDLFYHAELQCTVPTNPLESLWEVIPSPKKSSIVFHAVYGDNFQTPDSPSWYNPQEVAQVFYYYNELTRLNATNVGIITPYKKQVQEIRRIFQEAEFDLPRIGTVEDFQGQEFDVIILSTVRSSTNLVDFDVKCGLGFVASPRRLNVAISRAKILLIIIGNPQLLCADLYWRSVIDYCRQFGVCIGY